MPKWIKKKLWNKGNRKLSTENSKQPPSSKVIHPSRCIKPIKPRRWASYKPLSQPRSASLRGKRNHSRDARGRPRGGPSWVRERERKRLLKEERENEKTTSVQEGERGEKRKRKKDIKWYTQRHRLKPLRDHVTLVVSFSAGTKEDFFASGTTNESRTNEAMAYPVLASVWS